MNVTIFIPIYIILIILTCIFYKFIYYNEIIVLIILIIVLLFIIIRWFYKDKNNDYEKCISSGEYKKNGLFYDGCIDVMHILHILLWILIGILMPNKYILIIILSIIWEIIEHYIFLYTKSCKDDICGRVEDILLNFIGYIFGSLITITILLKNN